MDNYKFNLNPHDTLLKFDKQLPIYNWYYPFPKDEDQQISIDSALNLLNNEKVRRRALYFHIPFCDTICTFCPFYRSSYHNQHDKIDRYVEALEQEIIWKSNYGNLKEFPIEVITFGGGTPSILSANHIIKLGQCIKEHFNLSNLKEFTFELEVKSVTEEKLLAMRKIGVNRVSFGIQSFNNKYRKLFNITSDIENIKQVAELTNKYFPYVNIDMIYGMPGQTLDEVLEDIDSAIELKTTTIDFYPLNNMSASLKMHRLAAQQELDILSPATKVSYRMFMDEYLKAKGYVPINGYSYTSGKNDTNIINKDTVFRYHDILYGYAEDEVIGFGASAITSGYNVSLYNPANVKDYIEQIFSDQKEKFVALNNKYTPEKGIVYFPYRGTLEKNLIEWDYIPSETVENLLEAVKRGLIKDTGSHYELTKAGWLSYVNLVYYLTPQEGKDWLVDRIQYRVNQGRKIDDVLLYNLV